MSNDLVFLNQAPFWALVIGSVLLLTVFFWKEAVSFSGKRSLVKMAVALIAVLSLTLMALRPAIEQAIDKGCAVLVTQGHSDDRLDSLAKAHKNLNIIPYENSRPLRRKLDSVSSLFILGNGPTPYDFWQFEGIPTVYLGGNPSNGIIDLRYAGESTLGATLKIIGRYKHPKSGNYIVLQDPSGNGLDSVALSDSDFQNFGISTDLRVKGNFIYSLVEKDSLGEIRASEPLPISVKGQNALKVLMINSFPTFESKYLKNYLAEMNHEVLVRSQLTKGRYKFEYFNTERTPFYRFSTENLEKFDMLIIDAASFKNLSSRTQDVLNASTRDDGLGIFIQPDAHFFNLPKRQSHFEFVRTNQTETALKPLSKVKIDNFPYRFEKTVLVASVKTVDSTILAAYRQVGKGRVGTSVLKNTYQLVLDGNTAAYQQLWAETIEAISQRKKAQVAWEAQHLFAVKDRPYEFLVRTHNELPLVRNDEGSVIPLRQNPDLRHIWTGVSYPRKVGWNHLAMDGDSTSIHHFYAIDTTDWPAMLINDAISANKRYFSEADSEVKKTMALAPINPLWFFLLFLLCIGWLWLEPKLYGH